jgi:hypothetical protein
MKPTPMNCPVNRPGFLPVCQVGGEASHSLPYLIHILAESALFQRSIRHLGMGRLEFGDFNLPVFVYEPLK